MSIAKKYFEAFNNHSTTELQNLFSEDVVLIDWTNKWEGKSNVVSASQNLFNLGIKVSVEDLSECGNKIYCHIRVFIEGNELKVLDVLYLNEDNKISKIEAYNG